MTMAVNDDIAIVRDEVFSSGGAAALDRVAARLASAEAVAVAADWLNANRGSRGEEQAWRLLTRELDEYRAAKEAGS